MDKSIENFGSGRGSENSAALTKRLGQYELLELLGRGGMGTVHRARHVTLNRTVALKVLRGEQDSSMVRRFLAEARAAAQLDHPNIISIIDVGEDDGQFYIAMELIEGGNLGNNVTPFSATSTASAKTSQVNVARLVSKIARAVHHAHQRGILHRDLKPANILITSSGEPIVADFGIARFTGENRHLTQTGNLLGSPAYMAPEVAGGNHPEATTASDTYGLGAILYELLTGQPPFDGSTPLEVLKKVTDQEPPPLRASRFHIDPDLEIICLKCLNKEPSRRYPSAQDLAEDLERWLRHEAIEARPASTAERLVKWIRRKPVIAGLSLALAVTFACGVAAVVVEWRTALKSDRVARRNLYAADMSHAFRALQDNDFGRVRELLRLHETSSGPDLRDWEWDYLSGRCASMELATVGQMRGRVFDLVFSQDGSRFAAVASDGTVALFDAQTNSRIFEGHHAQPTLALAFAKNSPFMLTASFEAGLKKWAIPDGASELVSPLAPVFHIRRSPAQDLFAVAGYGVRLFSLEDRLPSTKILSEEFRRVAWSGDGKILAGGAQRGSLHLWNSESRLETQWPAHRRISAQNATIPALAISPDAHWLVSGGADERMFRWDLRAQNARTELTNFSGSIQTVAFSPDGKFLATGGSDQRIRVWDTKSWKILSTGAGHRSEISSLAWFPDGQRILSGSVDGSIKIWSKEDPGEKRDRATFPSSPDTLWISPDNSTVFTIRSNSYELWDLVSLSKLHLASGPPGILVSAPANRGRLVSALGEGKLCLWEANSGRVIDSISDVTNQPFWLSVSKDCSRVATEYQGTNQVVVEAWDFNQHRRMFTAPAERGLTPVLAWSNDGQYLVAGSLNGVIHVWDALAGRELASLHAHNDVLFAGCFSGNGRLFATAGMDGILKIWEVPTFKLHLPPFSASTASIVGLTFSENGRRIVTGAGDGNLRIWDTETGQEAGVLPAQKGFIRILGFLPDQTLVSVSADEMRLLQVKPRFSPK